MNGLFDLVILAPLVLWASMLLFPKRRFTLTLVMSPWPFVVLAAVAVIALAGQLATAGLPTLDLGAVATVLGSGWGALYAVSQIVTLGLFAGVWVFRDARYYGVRPAPYLLGTLLLGPIGVAAYLLLRRNRDRSDPVRIVN